MWVGDSVAVDDWDGTERRTVSGTVDLKAGESVAVRFDYASTWQANMFGSLLDIRVLEPVPEDLATAAVDAARNAEVAVVVVVFPLQTKRPR